MAQVPAFIQSQQSNDDDLMGTPAATAHESKAGGIVNTLVDLMEKAENELSDLRKAESSAKHKFEMLK